MLLRRKKIRPAVCGNRNIQNSVCPTPGRPAAAEPLEARRLFAVTVFTIQPDQSRITLSAEALGVNLSRQDTGSLTARYDGTIAADVTAGGIRFLGGSDMVAETRGRFDPGNAPGNYAGEARQFRVTIAEAVIRNLHLDVLSAAITTDNLGNFPSSAASVGVRDGQFDYDATGAGEGTFALDGGGVPNTTATPSTVIAAADGTTRLTLPVDVTFTYSNPPAELHLRGQIVAVAGTDRGLRPRVDANAGVIGTGYRSAFITTSGAAPVAAVDAAGLTVSDIDSPTLTGATAVLETVPNQPDETLAVDTGVTPITSSYDAATGTLTLTGTATPAQYQQVLRTLTYDNNSAGPAFGDRALRITLTDEVGPGAAAVNTVSVEEPFNVNVARIGTNAGPQGGRAVTFVDADGTVTTVNLIGGGHAYVRFTGAATQLLQNGAIAIGGTDVRLVRIDVTGTNALSKLAIRATGGNTTVDLGGVTSAGPLNTVGGRGVNLTGDMDVNGRINKATFTNVTGADITASNILKMTVAGTMTDSTLTLEDPFVPLAPVLGSLSVKGAITGSRIAATGNIGSIKAGSLVNSEVYAGVTGDDRFPSVAGDFANEAFIGKLSLKAPLGTASFDNSVVAANNLGRISLGLIDTDNGGIPFGVAGDAIASLVGSNSSGQRLRLTLLNDPAVLAAALPALAFTFGDFQIRLV